MRWWAILLVAFAVTGGCERARQLTPKLSEEQLQKLRSEATYLTEACIEKMRWNGLDYFDGDECTQRGPPKRWRGLFRNAFEGQVFCPAPARECPIAAPNEQVWLDLGSRPAALRDVPPGGLYEIDFVGRSTTRGTPMSAYGYDQDIILDRMISLKEIEPPPPEPTKAEMIAHFKECEAQGTCKPNWNVINEVKE